MAYITPVPDRLGPDHIFEKVSVQDCAVGYTPDELEEYLRTHRVVYIPQYPPGIAERARMALGQHPIHPYGRHIFPEHRPHAPSVLPDQPVPKDHPYFSQAQLMAAMEGVECPTTDLFAFFTALEPEADVNISPQLFRNIGEAMGRCLEEGRGYSPEEKAYLRELGESNRISMEELNKLARVAETVLNTALLIKDSTVGLAQDLKLTPEEELQPLVKTEAEVLSDRLRDSESRLRTLEAVQMDMMAVLAGSTMGMMPVGMLDIQRVARARHNLAVRFLEKWEAQGRAQLPPQFNAAPPVPPPATAGAGGSAVVAGVTPERMDLG